MSEVSENSDIGARASREGHEYHVAWAAKVALKLINPNTTLTGVAIEGFFVEDAANLSDEAMDIADLVQYHSGNSVSNAKKLEVLQFKYSPTQSEKDLTASDLKKTLSKFAKSQTDIAQEIGYEAAEEKTVFQFVSNRPIGENLDKAIRALRYKKQAFGHIKTQVDTLNSAIGFAGKELDSFLDRLSIIGKNTSREGLTGDTHRILSRLSGVSDFTARARLLEIQNLLRQKAGCDGASNNCVTRVDILGVLGVEDSADLYPSPESFPEYPVVLEREFIDTLSNKILSSKRPYIIHGPGGIGKTVVMQTLAKIFSKENEVILFDGFGGGSWRAPTDYRHLAKCSLLHIVNILASRDLCELIIPGADNETVLGTAVKRFKDAISTLQEKNAKGNIILLLDAIDHAGMRAENENSKSFAKELLKELDYNPIKGVIVVASCRTERRKEAYSLADYPDFEIPIFTNDEIIKLANQRKQSITSRELAILVSKSRGNPRCLDMMLKDDELINIPSVEEEQNLLDTLIERYFEIAVEHANTKGSLQSIGKDLIAALRLLPPPIPILELANIFNADVQMVESFISDLYPLVEATTHGLVFRDEPTETLAKKYVDNNLSKSDHFIQGLRDLQSTSVYCARVLPNLLVELNKPDELIELAFSVIFPSQSSSTVAKRNIRLSRISAAINGCIKNNRYDDIFCLVIEAASIANGTSRSDKYVLEFPDLATICDDPEIARRVFETKALWRGRRLSSQSLVYSFSHFQEEATRTSGLAIEWLNWGLNQKGEHDHSRSCITQNEDWFGAIYVMLLNGELQRILNWLDKRDGYNFITRILSYLVLNAKEFEVARECKQRIIDQACDGLVSSTYCLCAIILEFDLPLEQEQKIIKVLAEHASSPEKKEENKWPSTKDENHSEALLFIIVRAIKNNQRREAKALFPKIKFARLRDYEYGRVTSYQWRMTFWVLYTSVKIVLGNRKPNIADLVPEEIWEKIPKSALSRGPKRTEEAIDKLFEKKDVFDYSKREEFKRTLEHRCRPLLEIVDWIRDILLNSSKSVPFKYVIDQLSQKVNDAENYPFQDQKTFIAKVGFFSIFNAMSQTKSWTKENTANHIDWIKSSPLTSHSELNEVVKVWARQPHTHRAALEMCSYTAFVIKKETDTQTKIDDLAKLARGIWFVSKHEASTIFKQGIDLADKLGSEDYSEIEALIHCAQAYGGEEFSLETLHNFNRISELNFPYETEKFIWSGYGIALAKIGGVTSLSILSRLADRDIVSLEYSLGPLMSSLVENGKFDADLVGPLIGIDEVSETWTWDLSNLFINILSKLTHKHKLEFVAWIAKEYDRTYTDTPPKKSLGLLKEQCKTYQLEIPNYLQLDYVKEADEQEQKEPLQETINQFNEVENIRPINFDFKESGHLSLDISDELSSKTSPYTVWRRLAAILDTVESIDDVLALIINIAELDEAPLEDILKAYKTIKDQWGGFSVSVLDSIERNVVKAAIRKTSDFFIDDWKLGSLLRDICALTPNSQIESLCSILKAIGDRLMEFESSQWMRFAAFISNNVSDKALKKGLQNYIHVKTEDVPSEIGDGPWVSEFKLPLNHEEIVAVFLWNQLGSPYTRLRWRAAHSVIRYAKFGRFDIIEILLRKFESIDALPFHSPDNPFYYLNARVWLLIALTKISKDMVINLKPFSEQLISFVEIVGDHLIQKIYLMNILKAIQSVDSNFAYNNDLQELEKQTAPIKYVKKNAGFTRRKDSYHGRPTSVLKPEIDFHFDYDFKKHEINGLGSLFGTDTWLVSDDMVNVISEWDSKFERKLDGPRGYSSYDTNNDEQQSYECYLGLHSLFVVAGKYIRCKSVHTYWSEYEWEEWIEKLIITEPWLSDRLDFFPPSLPCCEIDMENSREFAKESERKDLANLISCQYQKTTNKQSLIISGKWSDKGDISYTISSALIDDTDGRNLSYALMSQNTFHNYLPTGESDGFDPWNHTRISNPLSSILDTEKSFDSRVDERDPYGVLGLEYGSIPNESVVKLLGLKLKDSERQSWVNQEEVVIFEKRIWGATFGRGRHERAKQGHILNCSMEGLKQLLQLKNKSLIVLICAQKYHKHKDQEDKFVNKSAVVLITPNGKIHPVQRLPRKIREGAEEMQSHERCNIIDCYKMVLRLNKKSRLLST
jgi:hypothetical protein